MVKAFNTSKVRLEAVALFFFTKGEGPFQYLEGAIGGVYTQ